MPPVIYNSISLHQGAGREVGGGPLAITGHIPAATRRREMADRVRERSDGRCRLYLRSSHTVAVRRRCCCVYCFALHNFALLCSALHYFALLLCSALLASAAVYISSSDSEANCAGRTGLSTPFPLPSPLSHRLKPALAIVIFKISPPPPPPPPIAPAILSYLSRHF